MSPLESILEWLRRQPEPVRGDLFFSIDQTLPSPGNEDPEERVSQWILATEDILTHATRAVSVRGIIDFEIWQRTDEQLAQKAFEVALGLVDAGRLHPEVRQDLNDQIGDGPVPTYWTASAASWARELRSSILTDRGIHDWMMSTH